MASDRIEGMTNKVDAPKKKTQKKSGDSLLGIGIAVAAISVIVGFATNLSGGESNVLPGIAVGVLLVIAGYVRRIASAPSSRD